MPRLLCEFCIASRVLTSIFQCLGPDWRMEGDTASSHTLDYTEHAERAWLASNLVITSAYRYCEHLMEAVLQITPIGLPCGLPSLVRFHDSAWL